MSLATSTVFVVVAEPLLAELVDVEVEVAEVEVEVDDFESLVNAAVVFAEPEFASVVLASAVVFGFAAFFVVDVLDEAATASLVFACELALLAVAAPSVLVSAFAVAAALW